MQRLFESLRTSSWPLPAAVTDFLLALGVPAAVQALRPPALSRESAWSSPLAGHTFVELLQAVVGLPSGQPLVYPLWFIRDLFALALLSPVPQIHLLHFRGARAVADDLSKSVSASRTPARRSRSCCGTSASSSAWSPF